MRSSLLCSIILALGFGATAHGNDGTVKLDCDITDIQDLYWPAMDQTVTLTTQLTSGENPWPDGTLALRLADGHVVDLGKGSKYIDDYDPANPPSCQDHLAVAQADTLHSLSPELAEDLSRNPWVEIEQRHFRTLGNVSAYSVLGQDCMDSQNLQGRRPSFTCMQAAQFRERYMEGLENSAITAETYRNLLDNDAPVITLRRSAYYSETFVYDTRDTKLYRIFTSGC